MAASSSSSLTLENGAELNPYQLNDKPGPKGAYEARQVNGGLYVRVDMPGVPPDGVKLVKYGETRKVTFTGKAPKYWISDSSERVYGGFVLLDQDPTNVKMTVKNGCFRLFFPGANGGLHCLPSKKSAQHSEHKHSGANQELGDSHHECCHNKLLARFEEPTPGINKGVLHSRSCPCRPEGADPSVSHTTTLSHINPYLVRGVEGVHETKLVYDDESVTRVYLRMDMPGLREKECSVGIMDYNSLCCGGDSRKEYHLDEGGRSYLSSFQFLCSCCKILAHAHELKHGVSRILIRQINIRGGRCSFSCSA